MKKSAGILAYRLKKEPEVFLVHPGGPYFKKKDAGAWTIPKGELTADEEALAAAQREFLEETGYIAVGKFIELSPIYQKGGKLVYAWAIELDLDEQSIISNTFEMEWPPKSGKLMSFPEIDKAQWFSLLEAREKINAAQVDFIDQLIIKNLF